MYTGVPNGNVEAGISFSEDFETKEVSQKLYIAGTAGKVTVEGFIEIYEYPHIEQRNILAHSSQIDKAGGLDAYLDKMKIISGTNVTILRLDLPTDEAMGGFASLHNQFKRKASFYNSASLYLESDHSNIIQSPQFSSQIGYWVVSDEYDL